MRILAFLIGLIGAGAQSQAQRTSHIVAHEMQHGFVLADDDTFASHLVATGHHSRQTEITGQLSIDDQQEKQIYDERKLMNVTGGSCFIFQAQALDLPSIKAGQALKGYIIESKTGSYEPKNIIVKKATYRVEKVLLNIVNPFFADQ